MQNPPVGLLARVRDCAPAATGRFGTAVASTTIAQGGMGYVELCGQRRGPFIQWFARKRMHPHRRVDPEFRRMFREEARLACLIRHRNIVRVRKDGEDADGPFMIMDYVEGVSLWTMLRRLTKSGELLPIQLAVGICRDIALGLHAAHEARAADGSPLSLVHRDVSPNNVLVGFDGSVRLADFGIAKALDNVSHTSIGFIKGTSGYVSPEQLLFQDVDRRSDLFALGVVLFELLTSTRLYGGPRKSARERALTESAPDIVLLRSEVPADLADLVRQLLAKAADLRPRTADEVASRLDHILQSLAHTRSSVSLAAYLNLHFRHTKERLRSLVADQLSWLKGDSSAVERVQDDLVTVPVKPLRERARSGALVRNWLALCAIVVLLAVAVGTGHALMLRGPPMGLDHLVVSGHRFAPDIVPLPARVTSGRPKARHQTRIHHRHHRTAATARGHA